jgi:stearoyl-CoA desaturase (delta-9 desaturase)
MQKPKIAWLSAVVLTLTGGIALVGVPAYALMYGFDIWQVSLMVIGVVVCEISITAGYHRLWAHRAYEAHWIVRLLLVFGGTFAAQNSILHWASDHRRHHRNVDDRDNDPYSAQRGFWYSHIGWMLREYNINNDGAYDNCADLKKDPIVMWQHRHYLVLVLGINFGLPILLGVMHGDVIGMLLLVGVARLVIAHHFTFFINSLAHIWGSQPYSDKNSSRDNGFLAVLTMGEGYHNYHHSFQRDYRNGIRWWQFDPTKWLIRTFAWLGLASNLYRTPLDKIESARAKMMLIKTSAKLAAVPHAEHLILRLHEEYETLMIKINEFAMAKRQWLEAKKTSVLESCDLDALKDKVEILKMNFLQQKKNWLMLNAQLV